MSHNDDLSPVSLISMHCILRAVWTETNRLDDFYMTCTYFTNDKPDDQIHIYIESAGQTQGISVRVEPGGVRQ